VRQVQFLGRLAQVLQARDGAEGGQGLERQSGHAGKHSLTIHPETVAFQSMKSQICFPALEFRREREMTTMTTGAGTTARRGLWRLRLDAALGGLARAWHERQALRRCAADSLALAHLSERMRRDIGVPERLCERDPGEPRPDLERSRW
jgi:hypothetical protein